MAYPVAIRLPNEGGAPTSLSMPGRAVTTTVTPGTSTNCTRHSEATWCLRLQRGRPDWCSQVRRRGSYGQRSYRKRPHTGRTRRQPNRSERLVQSHGTSRRPGLGAPRECAGHRSVSSHRPTLRRRHALPRRGRDGETRFRPGRVQVLQLSVAANHLDPARCSLCTPGTARECVERSHADSGPLSAWTCGVHHALSPGRTNPTNAIAPAVRQ